MSIVTINNKSPLRYPGGKTRACKKLDEILQQHFTLTEFNTLVSPFFGGGSFEFFLQNKYKLNIIGNDKFKPLYTFWNTCKTNKPNLVKKLYDCKDVTKTDFANYRDLILQESNDLTQAYYYFIINRCSFSGATLSGGFSKEASKKRFTESSIDRINSLSLDNFQIYNKDFSNFISEYSSQQNTLMFLDPPYYLEKGSKLYGTKGDLHETFEHDLLFEIIKDNKNWLLTYNDCEYVRNKYKDFIILEVDWAYGMNKSKKSSELVILSV